MRSTWVSFFERYEGDGRRSQPYHPEMMVKVLLYAYATGVFSSRKIAKKLAEDVAFRVLGGGSFPPIARSVTFVTIIWRRLAGCWFKWCSWPGRWGWSSWARWPWMARR